MSVRKIAAASGELQVVRLGDGLYAIGYPGYDPAVPHAVTGTPRAALAAATPAGFELIPDDDPDLVALLGSPPANGVVARVRHADGSVVAGGFNVRIEALT